MRSYLVFIFCFSIIFASCNSSQKAGKIPAASTQKMKKELTEEELINLKYLFVNAKKEKMLGNAEKAAEFFAQCIRIDGRNHAAMFELAQIYREQKKISDALFFARSAAELDQSNEWYKIFLGDMLMSAKKSQEAEKVYESLFNAHPHNIDYAFKYASALLYNGKLSEGIKIYDKVEEELGVTQELILEKERLWLRLGKVDKAAMELEKLIAEDPKEVRNYSLLVELYQVNNLPDKAFETIGRMQAVDNTSPYGYLALAEYYRSQNLKERSFENLKLAFQSHELEMDLKIKIIASYLPLVEESAEMLEQGLTLASILSEVHPQEMIAQAVYGDFLTMKKDFALAAHQYAKALELDNKNYDIWQKILITQAQLNDFNALLKTSSEAVSLFPDQSAPYLFNGIALGQAKKHAEAVKILLAGSKLVVDNDLQLKQFYTNLADNYNSLKQFEESDKYFEKALKIDSKDPLVLNNYSYYLSVRNENLEKAELMSKESNELSPGQPSYQDTYGWILFMMGKYQDAGLWLQKAIDNGGKENGTILEHMGDVQFKLGKTDEAVNYWKQAKEKGDVSDLIDKKIADKKLYE
jgi:tetratricopeptide (TPR) repeat protein